MKIGLDFPLKPEWIHDVHQLWKPDESVSDLVARALPSTMQELGGEKTRRNSLSILLRNFVTIEGGGSSRHTVSQDVWVAYSKKFAVSTLTPAYLVQLITQNGLADEMVRFINRRYSTGDVIKSEELKRHIVGKYGERKVITNAVSAFLRTLQYFSVLQPVTTKGKYQVNERLDLTPEVFPLVFWARWSTNPVPQVDIETFNEGLADAFINPDHLDDYWKRYQSTLWAVFERIGSHSATLKYPDPIQMIEVLIDTL
jgi:hypothetical protein